MRSPEAYTMMFAKLFIFTSFMSSDGGAHEADFASEGDWWQSVLPSQNVRSTPRLSRLDSRIEFRRQRYDHL